MNRISSHVIVAVTSTLLTLGLIGGVQAWQTYRAEQARAQRTARFVNAPPVEREVTRAPAPRQRTERSRAFSDLPDFRAVSREVITSVVNVTVLNEGGYRKSGGSGVVIDEAGYIITNYHVVDEASTIRVELTDKRRYPARLVGHDPNTDLALLKIEADGLRPIVFGNSDRVDIGEWVLAVGNPYNLTSTVTAGIVSAKGRNINILNSAYAIESFIQTDAVVNPGNSGGALVNSTGELIGINTAIISEGGGYEGYSFAIPGELVYKVYQDLRDFGRVRRAILGIGIRDLTTEQARRLGLDRLEGVLITNVSPGGSAEAAGLESGDLIVAIADRPTNSVPELQERVARLRPGDRVPLDFIRNGRRLRVEEIELGELPGSRN
jgi:serine protease Do